MGYSVYKLKFKGAVHFGSGMLSSAENSFCADTLFSALYTEALKAGSADELYNMVKSGRLLISDAFPYIESSYYLPKPMLYVEHDDRGDSVKKKLYKKLKFIPADQMAAYLKGTADAEKLGMGRLGTAEDQIMSSVRNADKDGNALPYMVGSYRFNDGCGLYVIIQTESDDAGILFEELMQSLSYTGIGGKRSAGKGRFALNKAEDAEVLINAFKSGSSDTYMLLSTALPQGDELARTLDGASYLLQRRSGFVYSETFADEQLKKKDLYTMKAGSCFKHRFAGDIYDVSDGRGRHPVYRYARAMFVGV